MSTFIFVCSQSTSSSSGITVNGSIGDESGNSLTIGTTFPFNTKNFKDKTILYALLEWNFQIPSGASAFNFLVDDVILVNPGLLAEHAGMVSIGA